MFYVDQESFGKRTVPQVGVVNDRLGSFCLLELLLYHIKQHSILAMIIPRIILQYNDISRYDLVAK